MAFGTRPARRNPEILIVPLIDILMVVLIFILATTTFRQFPSVTINLPKSGGNTPSSPPEVVIVSITTSPPAIFINRQLIDPAEIDLTFSELAQKNPELRIALNADRDAPFGVIMQVWQSAQKAGLTKIQALTQEAVVAPQ
jgi:biopolymer transport protein ExbD